VPDLLDDLRRYGDAVETAALDRDRPAYVADDEPEMLPAGRSPSRRMVLVGVAAVALVALVVSLTVLLRNDDHDSVRIDTPPTSITPPTEGLPEPAKKLPATTAYLIDGLDPGPLRARRDFAQVWSGERMVVWGGAQPEVGGFYNDGAAYDPDLDRWAMLPTTTLEPRAWPVAAWADDKLIIWGGSDVRAEGGAPITGTFVNGAALDLAASTWRPLAQSPLPVGPLYSGVWTGSELVVVGADETETHAAAYDPESDSWRGLSTAGFRSNAPNRPLLIEWTGHRVVAAERVQRSQISVLILDAVAASARVATLPISGGTALDIAAVNGLAHIATKDQLFTGTWSLDPLSGTWDEPVNIAHLECEYFPELVSLGTRVLLDLCGLALYHPDERSSQVLSPNTPVPLGATDALWTGEQLLLWFSGIPAGTPNFTETAPGFWGLNL
jgi:hypothetical protein